MIYMTHEKHGVHIAYDVDEAKKCEANGWKRMEAVDATPEAVNHVVEPVEVKPKRKYVRKAA